MKKTYYILFTLLFFTNLLAQESLYLIDTLVGTPEFKLRDAKGVGDLNGDGYADIAVSFYDPDKAYHQGTVTYKTYICFGNKNFKLKPSLMINHGLTYPGDVNNDGYDDFIFIKRNWLDGNIRYDKIYLGYGGENIDTTGVLIYEQQYWDELFSEEVEPIGDINGDGYNDFAISSPYNWSNGIPIVYIYLGGLKITPLLMIPFFEPISIWSDQSVAGVGDINEDGFDDFIIGQSNFTDTSKVYPEIGKALIYYGGENMDALPDTFLIEEKKGFNFGKVVKRVDNVYNNKNLYIIQSGWSIYFYNSTAEYLRIYGHITKVGCGGDINNDGYNDYILSYAQYKNDAGCMVGGAFVYMGGNIPDTNYCCKLEGENKWDGFGTQVDIIGDFNNDGYDDFIVVANSYPDTNAYNPYDNNEKGKLYLYSYKNYTTIEKEKSPTIKDFALYQNYPNPFNPSTTISYSIPQKEFVKLKIYNIMGKEIINLVNETQPSGNYKVIWNGTNQSGQEVSSGIYFCQLFANKLKLSKKMILIK